MPRITRPRFRPVPAAALTCLLLLLSVGRAPAQFPSAPVGRPTASNEPGLGAGHGAGDDAPFSARNMLAHQARRLRIEHQKQAEADAARLLYLAAELKQQADQGSGATADQLQNQVRDLDEIAKLAHRVSDRIRNQ